MARHRRRVDRHVRLHSHDEDNFDASFLVFESFPTTPSSESFTFILFELAGPIFFMTQWRSNKFALAVTTSQPFGCTAKEVNFSFKESSALAHMRRMDCSLRT